MSEERGLHVLTRQPSDIDETKYVVERWRMDYNHYRPHSSLDSMTPAGFAELCRQAGCVRLQTPVLDGVQDCGILSEALD
ncbi:integrase core domain-containing protein [Planctomycetota bacterium]